jgi:hypothetical protein
MVRKERNLERKKAEADFFSLPFQMPHPTGCILISEILAILPYFG